MPFLPSAARSPALLVVGAVVAIMTASTAQATNYTWNVDGGTLEDPNDWLPTDGPPGPGDTGVIGGGATETWAQVGLNLPSQPDELLVTTNGRLHVNALLTNDVVADGGRFTWSSSNVGISGRISLRSDSRFETATRLPNLAGLIQDDGGNAGTLIVSNTTGTLKLGHANNTYSGGTELHGGNLELNAQGCTGTGDVTVYPGGTLRHSNITLTNSVIVMLGGTLRPVANGNYLLTASILLKTNIVFYSGATNARLGGEISDLDGDSVGRIVKTGSGEYELYGTNNTFSGGLEIQGGRIIIGIEGTADNPDGSLGPGEILLHSGALLDFNNRTRSYGNLRGEGVARLGGGSSVIVTVAGVSPGTNDTVGGTFEFQEKGTLALDAASASTFHLASVAGPNDQVVFSHAEGKLTLAGALDVVDLGSMEPGDYTLFDLNGGTLGGAFAATNMSPKWLGSISTNTGDVVLTVTLAGTVLVVR